ncbi:MAG: hypothetical protein HYY26_07270 [Acidobacteria bacterium]|nr:hypothetical protein [Acidobacteriota bacterium]
MTVRRIKSYSAATGYVYQYHFEEVRSEPARAASGGSEYVFVVSRDRKHSYDVPVLLRRDALEAWERAHGRALNGAEQYAAVKMRLFQAFDEVEELEAVRSNIEVTPANIEELLAQLEIE